MKHTIAACLIAVSSSAALAESFAYERALGTPDLFTTLATDEVVANPSTGESSAVFTYQRQIGTPNLFSILRSESVGDEPASGSLVDDIPIWRDVYAHEADMNG